MLAGLIVNDNVNPKEGNPESLPQCLGDLPDDVIIWPFKHTFDFIKLQ